LSCAILEAYSRLHAQGVIHSDVHPRNLLVDTDGSVKIIDYGLARLEDAEGKLDNAHRGGVGFFFEPEYAKAHLANRRPPRSSFSGEQYALASLLYLLFTGTHYLDFSLEKNEMLRQIAEDTPLPFSQRGVRPWPGVEVVLARALSKDSSDRFTSVSEFARRLGEVPIPDEQEDGPLVSRATTGIGSAAAEDLLGDVLQRVGPSGTLLSSGVPSAPTCSINFGAAGIAYALYRIACVRSDAALLSLADLWSNKALRDSESSAAFYNPDMELTPETVGYVSPYHTASGVHAGRALVSHAMGDSVSHQEAIEAFVSASQTPCDNLDLTLGRSGVLLTCSLLLDTAPDNEALRRFGATVLRSVWDQVNTFAPVQECAQLSYLGIAHGWAGVLYATMRWCESSKRTLPGPFEERLEQLAECAEPMGRGVRWRVINQERDREHGGDYMTGWCHGSAGHVFLWTLAHRMLAEEAYLKLAEGAAWNAWELPTTLGSLCCGLAGQAYGLLNLYKHTGEGEWVFRALELANRAPFGLEGAHFPADSLYKGKLGVGVLAAELSRPEVSCMPLFEEEGWPRVS